MSFKIDDPLAGILSDGSDDSFFDDDILGKKKPTKVKDTPTADKKTSLFDIGETEKSKENPASAANTKKDAEFDFEKTLFDEPKKSNPLVSKDSTKTQPNDTKSKAAIDVSKSPFKPKISANADKLDFLNEPKKETKPLGKGKSSQSLLDDILGGPSVKEQKPSKPVTSAKSDFDLDSFLGKSDTKTATPNKVIKKQTTKTDNPREESAPQKKKSSEDWLGLFQEKEDDEDDEVDSGMPSWLVGDTKKKKKDKQPDKKAILKEEVKDKSPEEKPQITEKIVDEDTAAIKVPKNPQAITVPTSSIVLQGSNENITAEGAALYLQQQEAQLMVAMQLKAQEERLVAMKMRQKESQRVQREATIAHHSQLDAILKKQSENRQQMQAIIAAHQERITQRIKDLLVTDNVSNEEIDNMNEVTNPGTEQKDTPHTRERKQLLQLVQSLQENHDKEIDLMETSYRRQLAFLEVSLNQSEERMKEESDKLVRFYTEKIGWLEQHHHLYKKMTEDNLNALTERHKAENEMLRQQHLDNVRILQEHHAALMENIKNAVKQEQVLMQDSAGFSSNLQELLVDIKENKSQCQVLVDKVQSLAESTQRDTDRNLHTREANINDMIQQLKKERDNFEVEKTESRDMIKMLEARLKQMTSMIEEETSSLKQKKMEFDFEKATFNKQTEFAKNILKKQDEQLQAMKEEVQKEYQDKIAKIDEEKAKVIKDSAAVAKEKASAMNLKQELEKMKAELQAQLEEVSEERSKLNAEKQQMHMEEQRIMAKSRDLDILAKSAIEKQSQADKKYSEAEFLQRKYEDRIRRIQEHVVSLNSREKQIAREKVALSRERLTLHNERKQIEGRQQCSLCKSTQPTLHNFENTYTLPESFLNASVPRDSRDIQVNSAMNAIEQEMAHLMSRNFNLRHNPLISNLSYEGRHTRSNIGDNLPSAEAVQMESGSFKDYMDPKFMMLRLDVQKVLSNLDQSKRDDNTDAIDED